MSFGVNRGPLLPGPGVASLPLGTVGGNQRQNVTHFLAELRKVMRGAQSVGDAGRAVLPACLAASSVLQCFNL